MPITSTQINGVIGGQQAMFGNAATYAAQINPYAPRGSQTSYSNPMAGAGYPSAMAGNADFNRGQGMSSSLISGASNIGLPLMGGVGMMMGGAAGGLLDPFTGAMRGFGSGIGAQAGSGISGGMSALGRAGVGGITRGLGMAAAGALPALAIGGAAQYAGGQMLEGAQFQGQVNSFLQNQFRFTNQASRTGYGFDTQQQRGTGRMLQEMGHEDIMSTPQEMLRIMERGTQAGVFKGVREAKEFRRRFKEMTSSLKEIARTFNTTLEDAMPFFNEARRQGFWTPQDIMQHSQQIKQVQATTGMSAAQAQSVTGVGAQMSRSIGGTGQQGASMMARAQMMTGSALFGGTVSSQQLQEAGMGMGAEGAQNLGTMLAGASARFARSRVGRWTLAASMNQEGTGLDPEKLRQLTEGNMSVGEISSAARRNVSGGRAYKFVQNEQELRGQLAEQGPEATLGFVKSLTGERLHGGTSKDQLITRRIIKRFMGGTSRQADLIAEMARDLPRLQEMQAAQSETSLDAQERQQQEALRNTFEGFKRRVGQFWREKVTGPLQETGADFSQRVGRAWQRFQDKMFNTTGRSVHLQRQAVQALSVAAETGDMSVLRTQFAGKDLTTQTFGDSLTGPVGVRNQEFMEQMGFQRAGQRFTKGLFSGTEDTYSREQVDEASALHRGMRGQVGEREASALGFDDEGEMQRALTGGGAKGFQKFLKSGEALAMRGRMGRDMDQGDQMKLARQYLARVRSGAAGDEAKRTVQGLDERKAIGRLSAMQGGGRGGFTGFGLEGPGAEGVSISDTRSRLEEASDSAREDLVTMLRGGVSDSFFAGAGEKIAGLMGGTKGVAVTEEGMRELEKDKRASEAFNLFSRAKQDGDEGMLAQARQLMADVANDKESGLSDAARSAAIRLSDANDPSSKQLADSAGKIGDVKRISNSKEFIARSKSRMDRMRSILGEDRMSKLRAAAKDAGGMSEAMRQLVDKAGDLTPKKRLEQLKELAKSAAESPEAAGKMMDIIGDTPGGAELRLALGGGRELSGLIKRGAVEGADEADIEAGEAKRSVVKRARRGMRGLLGQMGISKGISNEEINKLMRGEGSEKTEELLGKKGWSEDQIDKFMKGAVGGLTRDELKESGLDAAVGRAIRPYDQDVSKEMGLKPGTAELTGREGSLQEIGKNLSVQTTLLKNIESFAATTAGRISESIVVKNKKE